MDGIYDLLTVDDDTAAKERAAAMAAALRRQQEVGTLASIIGGKTFSPIGQALSTQAAHGQEALGQAGQARLTRTLQLARDKRAAEEFGVQQQFREKQLGQDAYQFGEQMKLKRDELGSHELLARLKAQAHAKEQAAKSAGDLRKELQGRPEFKAFQEVSTAYDKVRRSQSGTPAADMSLIFGYMKLLDPGSTVREGEYASAQNATGVPGQIINLYNKSLEGQLLNPKQRADFVGQAGQLFGVHRSRFDGLTQQYSGLASKSGASPEDVILGLKPKASGLSEDEAKELQALEKEFGAGQ